MRIAALYDIHGNLPALRATMDELANQQIDWMIIGGDVIAGPFPSKTLTYLQDLPVPVQFIIGNAESELLRVAAGKEAGGLSEAANQQAAWLNQTFNPIHIDFISNWPATVELPLDNGGTVLFCHATPTSDIKVFTRIMPEEKIIQEFANLQASLVVCGHTHMQFDRVIGGVRVVNAGSVGMPFGKTGADWLIIDGDEIDFQHTDYDMEDAAEQVRGSIYPNAENFAVNNILNAPTEEQALQMLSGLEHQQENQR